MRRAGRTLLALLLLALAAWGRPQSGGFERIELRVTGLRPAGLVAVDRGEDDGLAVGDLVLFHPRAGGTAAGNVVRLEPRSALVEMHDRELALALGTKGEVEVPRSRLAAPEPEPPQAEPVAPDPGAAAAPADQEGGQAPAVETPEPGSQARGGGLEPYTDDTPLLTRMRPVRPEERAVQFTGRVTLSGDATYTTFGDRSDSFLRAGGDLAYDNPFGRGGSLHVDAEANLRTTNVPDANDENYAKLRLDRFSYASGGTRFQPLRWEAGRFLQHGMVEFGVLDGVEWSWRRRNGNGFGVSVGLMPEPTPDFSTGDDLQVATWYRWILDHETHLSVDAGYQKTWHNGSADRDLLVTRLQYAPADAWNLFATTWVDYYGSTDRVKGTSLSLTQALVLASRRWEGSGVNVSFTHQRFPEIERKEFATVEDDQLADDHDDRLSLAGWRMSGPHRLHGELGGWVDEEDGGGDCELGVDFEELFAERSHTDFTGFVSYGEFSHGFGGQATFGRWLDDGRWDLFYEFSWNTIVGFADDADDVLQHRLRFSRDLRDFAGWSVDLHAEGRIFDDEGSITLGFYLQRRY